MQKIFIGVAWPYVNGDLHLGHLAGYLLPADIYARFHRFRGHPVLMVSGSDCFGTPITVEADKRGLAPGDVVEEYHAKDVKLFEQMGLSYDLYTRTDNETHQQVVQELFVRMLEQGYIFKDTSQQFYSAADARFLPDRYVEGICPHCDFDGSRSDQCDNCGRVLDQTELKQPRSKLSGSDVELRDSEHYFIDWPKLQSFLEKYVDQHSKGWRKWVRQETKKWLKEGLQPRAITRDLDWGVPLPVDRIPADQQLQNVEHKRIYVWFDAVSGYLSAAIKWASDNGRPQSDWKDFWYDQDSKHVYFMGKDNLVFHTLFWPGQIHSYDPQLKLPDLPLINQYLTLAGQGFSKSRGITINSQKAIDRFGLDVIRFYLTAIMPENADADFTWEDFQVKTNNLLIANVGNFIYRSIKLAQKLPHLQSELVIDGELDLIESKLNNAAEHLENGEFRAYINTWLELSAHGNQLLSEYEPWKLLKSDPDQAAAILNTCVAIILASYTLMVPVLPHAAERLAQMLSVDIPKWPTTSELQGLVGQIEFNDVSPLFAKVELPDADELQELT